MNLNTDLTLRTELKRHLDFLIFLNGTVSADACQNLANKSNLALQLTNKRISEQHSVINTDRLPWGQIQTLVPSSDKWRTKQK